MPWFTGPINQVCTQCIAITHVIGNLGNNTIGFGMQFYLLVAPYAVSLNTPMEGRATG